MSYVRIWVHCVWGTKRAVQYFTNSNKNKIMKARFEWADELSETIS